MTQNDEAIKKAIYNQTHADAQCAASGWGAETQGNTSNYPNYPSTEPATSCGGMLGMNDAPPSNTLRDRVEIDLMMASRAARKLEKLVELRKLLDRNPQTARILDLIEETR